MKLVPILAVLLFSSTSFAGSTSHQWFAKVPVTRTSDHAKHTKYAKGFNGKMKTFKTKQNGAHSGKSAILTRIISK